MPIDTQRVKAICFDVDGTLRDTDDQMVQRFSEALQFLRIFKPDWEVERTARRLVMGLEDPGTFLYGIPDRLGFDDHLSRLNNALPRLGHAKKTKKHLLIDGVEQMLQQLYQATTYKARLEQIKEDAKREDREGRHRIKACTQANIMYLFVTSVEDGEDLYVQTFTINLDLVIATHQLSTAALIDSRADCNVMSHEIWKFLGKPKLVPSKLSFKSFSRTQNSSLGKLCINVCINAHSFSCC